MKDRFFYPLAVAVIAGIIAVAFIPGGNASGPDKAQILTEGYALAGNDLVNLYASGGTEFVFVENSGNDAAYGILSSNLPRNMAPASAGVFATLGSAYEGAFAGHKLQITISARQDGENPLESFEVGYFTSGPGDSGWRAFTLTPKYKDYSFTFTPKAGDGPPGRDYVGIWPGVEGKKKRMHVRSFTIKVTD